MRPCCFCAANKKYAIKKFKRNLHISRVMQNPAKTDCGQNFQEALEGCYNLGYF